MKFLEDTKTQNAVIRNFKIIGEACRNIEFHHPGFAANHIHNDLPGLAEQLGGSSGKMY